MCCEGGQGFGPPGFDTGRDHMARSTDKAKLTKVGAKIMNISKGAGRRLQIGGAEASKLPPRAVKALARAEALMDKAGAIGASLVMGRRK